MKQQKDTQQAIETKVWKGRQSAEFRSIFKLGEVTIKIDIKRDSYDFQSHAVAYAFNIEKLEWNAIYSIPYPLMATLKTVNVHADGHPVKEHFSADLKTMLDAITKILGK